MAMSSKPIWDEPSSPMDTPAWDPQILMFAREYWLMRIWSKARVRKAAKVETKGILPRIDRPSALPIIFCSAIYISKKRSGYFNLNISEYVELLTSASSTTIFGNFGYILSSAVPYA